MRSMEERFWEKVDRTGSCWLWKGYKLKKGYGQFRINDKAKRAHRVSFSLMKGEIPDGLCVLHHCDNPSCVNPDHLYLGTEKDNARDRDLRHRRKSTRGVLHGRAKINWQDVEIMRQSSKPHSYFAKKYNLDASHIGKIRKNKYWVKDDIVVRQ